MAIVSPFCNTCGNVDSCNLSLKLQEIEDYIWIQDVSSNDIDVIIHCYRYKEHDPFLIKEEEKKND